MPGDEQGEDLVADVLPVEQAAGVVDRHVHHPAEQVVDLRAALLALGDDAAQQVVDGAVSLEGGAVLPADEVPTDEGEGCDVGAGGRVRHRRDEGRDEGVDLLAVEAGEGVAEGRPGDRLEGELGQPRRDVDGAPFARCPVPDADELVRRLDHDVVVPPHRRLGEGRHEQVVREAPVGLVGVRGEEPVADEHPQVVHPRRERLAEAGVVAQLADEVGASGEDELPAEGDELEDRPEVAADAQHVLHRRRRVAVLGERVPEDRSPTGWVGEGVATPPHAPARRVGDEGVHRGTVAPLRGVMG